MLREILSNVAVAVATSWGVAWISSKKSEEAKRLVTVKYETYLSFVNTFGDLFIHRYADPDKEREMRKTLLSLFNTISLVGSEKVARELIKLKDLITQNNSDSREYLPRLEMQIARIKNEMRQDLGTKKFIDISNALSFFGTTGESKTSQQAKTDRITNIAKSAS